MKQLQLVCYKLHLQMQFNCIKKIFHLRILKNLRSGTNLEITPETKICFKPFLII